MVTNVGPLAGCRSLKTLVLGDEINGGTDGSCTRVRDVECLSRCPNLADLDLSCCFLVRKVDALLSMPALKRLVVERCKNVCLERVLDGFVEDQVGERVPPFSFKRRVRRRGGLRVVGEAEGVRGVWKVRGWKDLADRRSGGGRKVEVGEGDWVALPVLKVCR